MRESSLAAGGGNIVNGDKLGPLRQQLPEYLMEMQEVWESATEQSTSALVVLNFDPAEIKELSEVDIISDKADTDFVISHDRGKVRREEISKITKFNFYVHSVYSTL